MILMLKKIGNFIFIVIAAVFFVNVFFSNSKTHTNKNEPEYRNSQSNLDRENIELNYGLPVMLDRETMVEKIIAKEYEVVYILKMVNYPAHQFNKSFLGSAQEIIGERNCSDIDIKFMYEKGRFMKYIIYGNDNQLIGSFIISNAYCNRFNR